MIIGEKANKEVVNYRNMSSCGTCTNYNSPTGGCKLVEGNISPKMVCDKYAIKEVAPYRDKEFFEKEYNANNG